MRNRSESTKQCHLIWMTRDGRSWFKIAAAARFCEHAVHHACAALGWRSEVIAVFPDRVHVLVAVPLAENRYDVSAKLQRATTRLLTDGRVLPDDAGNVWSGDGWCAVLSNAVSAAAVRRLLREKLAAYDDSGDPGTAPSRELMESGER